MRLAVAGGRAESPAAAAAAAAAATARWLAARVLSEAAETRTVAAAPRSPPGAASPGDTFPASVGWRPAALPSAPAAGPECRPEACGRHGTFAAVPPRPPRSARPPGA